MAWPCDPNGARAISTWALPNFSRSLIPSPPSFLGLMQVFQFTRQCPPVVDSASCPFQRKPLLYLSILFRPHFGILNIVIKHDGIAERTDLTNNSFPG
jgi:hypothetical protein